MRGEHPRFVANSAPHPAFGHPLPVLRPGRGEQTHISLRGFSCTTCAWVPCAHSIETFLLPASRGEGGAQRRMRGRGWRCSRAECLIARKAPLTCPLGILSPQCGERKKREHRPSPSPRSAGRRWRAAPDEGLRLAMQSGGMPHRAKSAPHLPFGHPLPAMRGEEEARTSPVPFSPQRGEKVARSAG